jgi:hypothetical protein
VRRRSFFLLLFGTCLITRVFYFAYVWADEGLWFTVAQEMLRGKILYREIWFDKPPALAVVFEALFALGSHPLLVVRFFTVIYAFGVCLLLWHMGRTFWSEREGRLAALAYAFYNATYLQSQVQPLAGDHLMLLPYLASGFCYLQGEFLWGGLLASFAFQLNPKAAALALLLVAIELLRRDPNWLRRLAIYSSGFVTGTLPWLIYLSVGAKSDGYFNDFWGWGMRYVGVYTPAEWITRGVQRTLNYAGFHAPLVLCVILLFRYSPKPPDARSRFYSHVLLAWLAVSYLGVASGGRFFPRYFYQVLPLLCLLAARGYRLASATPAWKLWRVALAVGLALSLVRFHTRTAVLAWETISGRKTAYMANWTDTALDRDSRKIAAAIPAGSSLFVWGYRPEIYFYCSCLPASPFLSSQPLTGVPADIHLRESTSAAPAEAAANRARLAQQLLATPPDFVVDGLGPYNPQLAMAQYPELRAILDRLYHREGWGNGWIYRRIDYRRFGRTPESTVLPVRETV